MFDLHFHSTYSDGKLTVPELAAAIKEKKLEYCALTDHNTVDGIPELIKCLEGSGSTVIPATELTTKYKDNEVHILAYDFDIDAVAQILKERNEIVRNAKIVEMETATKLFIKEGLEITPGSVPNEKQPVGLTMALDICGKSTNQDFFQKKYGRNFVPEDIYYEYQAPGKPCAVERSGVTIEWVVQKFKDVAHDLIIAHPFVSVSVVTKPLDESSINDLLEIGITGIEIYHNETSTDQIEFLKKIADLRALNYTGGSDFHGYKGDTMLGYYTADRRVPSFRLTRFNLK